MTNDPTKFIAKRVFLNKLFYSIPIKGI